MTAGSRMIVTGRNWPRITAAAILALFAAAQVPVYAAAPEQPQEIDLILTNGQIKTPSGWAEAMAVRDGVIVAVGKGKKIAAMRSRESELIDLHGAAVLPGLHDMHVHPLFAGMEQFTCGFKPGASADDIAEALTACVAVKPRGEWVLGGNWVAAAFTPGQQDKQFLDAVAPDHPVVLNDESHHSVWVNSMALQLAGITRDSPNPQGGIIERDANGDPNGLLRESATWLVEHLVPPASETARREALVLASNQMLSFGITSFMVASVRTQDMSPLSALSEEGLIKQRVRGCIVWAPEPEQVLHSAETLIANRASFDRPRFSTDCIKIFLDGVPTESHTGAMLEPYQDVKSDFSDDRPEKGLLLIPQDILNKAVAQFDRQGLLIKFHAAGDAAVRAAIDAVSAARESNGYGGPMHHVGHSVLVSEADIPRVKQAHMSWEFSPYIWYPTPMAAIDIRAAVGDERMQRWVPIKDAVDSGALVVAGSDWSVVPSVNPWLAIETMVTRQMPGGSTEELGEQQRVSIDQAFRIMTENGAHLMGHRDQVGSIEVGMLADVVVVERNPFDVPIEQLHATKVVMTFIDGVKVYDIKSPPQLTAR